MYVSYFCVGNTADKFMGTRIIAFFRFIGQLKPLNPLTKALLIPLKP